MADTTELLLTIPVEPGGRIVIPRDLLDPLCLEEGESLIASVEDGRLVLRSHARALRELQDLFKDTGGGMADELIAERRQEAHREMLEYGSS